MVEIAPETFKLTRRREEVDETAYVLHTLRREKACEA
jgi:hypothetical protein